MKYTSIIAYAKSRESAEDKQRRIIVQTHLAGEDGVTASELADRIGVDIDIVATTCSALWRKGVLRDTGRVRKSTRGVVATVYDLYPDGQLHPQPRLNACEVAAEFHATYERLAPCHGYETRAASAKPWAEVPENNRELMTEVVQSLVAQGVIRIVGTVGLIHHDN